MLKVNVGLSRKLTRDYNSNGFSVNIEGEVMAPANDPESVINGVKELYELAEEALDLEVERFENEKGRATSVSASGRSNRHDRGVRHSEETNGNGHSGRTSRHRSESEDIPATHKQINYLLTLGKRQQLSTIDLEQRIEAVLGETVGIYDLTKREAGRVIETLTAEPATRSRR